MAATPSPTPAVLSEGVVLTAAMCNGWSSLLSGLYNRTMARFQTRKPFVVARTTTALALTSGTSAVASFTSEGVDTDAMFTTASPTVVKVNTAGVYRLLANAAFDSTTGGCRFARILVNGTSPSANAVADEGRTAIGTDQLGPERTIRLAVNASVYLSVLQTSGSQMNLTSALLAAEWIAP